MDLQQLQRVIDQIAQIHVVLLRVVDVIPAIH